MEQVDMNITLTEDAASKTTFPTRLIAVRAARFLNMLTRKLQYYSDTNPAGEHVVMYRQYDRIPRWVRIEDSA